MVARVQATTTSAQQPEPVRRIYPRRLRIYLAHPMLHSASLGGGGLRSKALRRSTFSVWLE